MRRSTIGFTALLALGLIACGQDQVTQPRGSADRVASDRRTGDDGDDDHDGDGRRIAIRDACDPRDPAWAPTGGCAPHRGPSDVNLTEFNAFLLSPLSSAVVGHQAWRNQPSYIVVEQGKVVKITNEGGRLHTFTEVEDFGGGRVAPLNVGLVPAPECLAVGTATDIRPGETMRLREDDVGIERYQCCIHPWMRALIKVTPGHEH